MTSTPTTPATPPAGVFLFLSVPSRGACAAVSASWAAALADPALFAALDLRGASSPKRALAAALAHPTFAAELKHLNVEFLKELEDELLAKAQIRE